jgi:hypothetical protein
MAGWGGAIDKIISKLPIQDRRERIKNHIEDLRTERAKLVKEPSSVKTSKRITIIDLDIVHSEQLLRNLE